MAFDPFNDFGTHGYLRNHAGTKDPAIVRRLEHSAFSGNILRALKSLQSSPEINLEHVQETHRLLFQDIYPWAGEDRSQNASDLNITKGAIDFQLAPYVQHGVVHALKNARDIEGFKADPGKVIGELAYAHPFLEGNGRTITAVVSELARRAGFHIAWRETNKQEYLKALTLELAEPNKRHLTNYLKPFLRHGELGLEQQAVSLSTLPGLSAPEGNLERVQESKPVLTIVAGPNGAGKSSLTASGALGDVNVIDPDAIARQISPGNPEAAARRAGKRALDLRNGFLFKQQSFAIETTLSGNSTLSLIDEAKAHGFRIELKYIGLESEALAKGRVASRVSAGGHDVPDEDISRRFARSLENLSAAISKSDHVDIYDNSDKDPLKLVANLQPERSTFRGAPGWSTDAAFEAAQLDLGKAETVAQLEQASKRAFDAAIAGGVTDDQLNSEVKKLERVQERKNNRGGNDL